MTFLYQQLKSEWSSLMNEENKEIEDVALELVMKVRRLHFHEVTSKSARTKKIKEILEHNSKRLNKNAT